MLLRRILTPFIILLFATAALAQSKDSVLTDGATGPVTSQPRWRPPQYPTASHGMLEALSGRWSITASLWLAGPDKPPVTGAGYGRWRTMFDSRYLEIDDSVSIAGRPVRILGYVSWEAAARQLQLQLFTQTGAMLLATSAGDSAWKDFTFTSAAPRPMRCERLWIDGNHWRLAVFVQSPRGREYKLVDADYRRSYGP